MKEPVEIYNEINPSELADNKIWIDIQPVDDWKCWSYRIYMEDCMSPFFEVYSDGQENHFKSYSHAQRSAIAWLEENGHITIIDLPF